MKRKLLIISLLSLILALFAAVSSAQDKKLTIGLSIPSKETGFFKYLIAGAEAAAADAQAELKIVSPEFDSAAEVTGIQSLIDEAVGAILIYPVDYASDNLVSSIQAANKANIPVFILGKDINRGGADLQIASVLSPANETMAGVVGKYFCDSVGGAKTVGSPKPVVILKGIANGGLMPPASDPAVTPAPAEENPQVVALNSLVDGLGAYVKDNCDGVHLLVEDTTTYDNADSIAYFNKLIADGTDVGGIFATNTALVNSLQDEVLLNDLHDLKILTSAVSADTLGALETESITGIIAPEPTELGKSGVEKAVDLIGGKAVDANTDVSLVLIDASAAVHYRGTCPYSNPADC